MAKYDTQSDPSIVLFLENHLIITKGSDHFEAACMQLSRLIDVSGHEVKSCLPCHTCTSA